MKYKTSNFVLFVFWLGCIFLLLNVSVQSQTKTGEKPRLKDFGSSLKQKKEKNKDKSKQTNEKTNDDEEVIKVDTNLVRTDVLVINERGNAILGLKKEDFIVTENNVTQEIGFFSLGDSVDIPRSIVLIIDYSGSQKPYMNTSIEAAKNLVDKLNPKDRMAIVTDDVKLLADFTGDKKLLKKKLDVIREKSRSGDLGKSNQYSALIVTLNEMFDKEDIRPMVIFQTDGDEIFNTLEPEENNSGSIFNANYTVSDVVSRIEKSRATIYPVVAGFPLLGLSREEIIKTAESWGGIRKSDTNFMKVAEMFYNQKVLLLKVAEASGGFASKLEKPEQAEGIYSKILEESNSRYLIGYYPENSERDGKRRNVKIEVRGHPEYIVWGRKTYFAPEKD